MVRMILVPTNQDTANIWGMTDFHLYFENLILHTQEYQGHHIFLQLHYTFYYRP